MRNSIKPLVALVLTGIGSALVFSFRTTDPVLPTSAVAPRSTQTTSSTRSTTGAATPGPKQPTTPTPTAGSQYADGTYTGVAVNEPWGAFEVQAVISDGKLADVQLVESPRDRHSNQINAFAVPLLTEAAVAAQSATIDMVSGATWTSQSYEVSLQAALDEASAGAVTEQQDAA